MISKGAGFKAQSPDTQVAAGIRVSARVADRSRSSMGDELYAAACELPGLSSDEEAIWSAAYDTRRAEVSTAITALFPVLDVHQLERALGEVTAIAEETGGFDG